MLRVDLKGSYHSKSFLKSDMFDDYEHIAPGRLEPKD